jgi:hypothetical protein
MFRDIATALAASSMTDSSHEGMAVWLIRTVALLVPALPVAAIAGDWELPSDVGVTLTASPTSQLRVGQPIDITFTATNNGMEELPVVITESNRFVDEFDVVSVDPACLLFLVVEDLADGSYDYLLDWDVASAYSGTAPALEPGETRVCRFQIALRSSAPAAYSFSFGLSKGFHDPDPSNDRETVVLQRAAAAPAQVPALSAAMLWLLAALSASVGMLALGAPRRAAKRR